MMNELKNLEWSFSLNERFYSELLEMYSWNERYLRILDDIIAILRSQNCQNIQDKVRDIGSLKKFFATFSELRFAVDLGRKSEVTLLSDGYGGGGAPDMMYSLGGHKFLVEVTRISDDGTSSTIFDFLRPYLRDRGYRVDSLLKEELVHPKLTAADRERNETYVKSSLIEFTEKFPEKVGRRTFSIETAHIRFEAQRTRNGKGYPGIVSGGAFWVDSDYLMEYTKRRIIEKAAKAEKYFSTFPDSKYIIAVDCEEGVIDNLHIDEILYGQRVEIGATNDGQRTWRAQEWLRIEQNNESIIPDWNRIEMAANLGWEAFLSEKHLIPNNFIYLKESGLFLNVQEASLVSGILFKQPVDRLSFFPNPFCREGANLKGNLEIR